MVSEWQKLSNAVGSATPDPDKGSATSKPIPSPTVANKPPAGRRGPTGLQPRQTFSRVNTGVPPIPDAGTAGQKSQRPRGLEFLPAKVAHQQEESMSTTMMPRPDMKALVKEAMEGTAAKVDIELEAARQMANAGQQAPGQEKTASAPSFTSSEHVEKVANALDWLSKQAAEGTTSLGPGQGPNETGVLETTSSEENIDTKGLGQATSKHVVPQNPPTQKGPASGDPGTALQTNDEMQHPEQPEDPWSNEKTSAALLEKNLARLGLRKEAKKDEKSKEGSALLANNLRRLGLNKLAEDALNPAKVAGGSVDASKLPDGASPSEEGVPSEPSDVNKQKSMISSNDSAINYTKGQAKADPKSDVNKVLTEPAQTKSTDPVLQNTLDHASSAGVKVSSAEKLTKTAAAQALLCKLAQEVDDEKKAKKKEEKKEKSSMGGGGLNTPAGQSGFTASSMT